MSSSPVAGVHVESEVLHAANLVQLFTHIPDPRHRRGVRHSLPSILAVVVAAVAAGSTSLTAISQWATDVGAALLSGLGLGDRVPSEATIRRVIEALDDTAFSLICGAWLHLHHTNIGGQTVIAVDGKTVRGARTPEHNAPHLLAALTHDTGVVTGQLQIDSKTNEIPAIRDLLRMMNIDGVIITADALHTQHETARFILGQGADYLLTVKNNQPSLRAALAELPWSKIPAQRSTEHTHGRTITRTIKAVQAPGWIEFPGAAQVLQVRRTRTTHGKRSTEVVYLICSRSMIQAPPQSIAAWIQGHWAIENRLHWVRDVTFNEDRSQIRTGTGPAMMAALRNLIISLYRLTGATNIAATLRHHARNPERIIKLLLTSP